MLEANETQCKTRRCEQPAAGVSPISDLTLCQKHLQRDIQKVRKDKDQLLIKLQALRATVDTQTLRKELQALDAEINDVCDVFDDLLQKVQQWKERTVSMVQAVHDSIAASLKDAHEIDECEKDLSKADEAGDMKKVLRLSSSIEPLVEKLSENSIDLDSSRPTRRVQQTERLGASKRETGFRCVGDVSGGVQQLLFLIDRHMKEVMQSTWLDSEDANAIAIPTCQSTDLSVSDLESQPWRLAVCYRTGGFAGDKLSRVVRVDSVGKDCVPLPRPTIFVAFHSQSQLKYLLATSLDGTVRLQCHCDDLNWTECIHGIHADDKRQQLFIAQPRSISVTDLSGKTRRVISVDSLCCQEFGEIVGIAGTEDKLFVLGRENIIVAIGLEPGQLEPMVSSFRLQSSKISHLSLWNRRLLLMDKTGKVHSACSITNQLLASYPTNRSGLEGFRLPFGAAASSKGVLFVSEFKGHTVRALDKFGAVLQTIGTPGVDGDDDEALFYCPGQILTVELKPSAEKLVVADFGNHRLRVFDL